MALPTDIGTIDAQDTTIVRTLLVNEGESERGNDIFIGTSSGWVSLEGPPGSPGIVETYEQTDEPETSTIGAIWIRQEPL